MDGERGQDGNDARAPLPIREALWNSFELDDAGEVQFTFPLHSSSLTAEGFFNLLAEEGVLTDPSLDAPIRQVPQEVPDNRRATPGWGLWIRTFIRNFLVGLHRVLNPFNLFSFFRNRRS